MWNSCSAQAWNSRLSSNFPLRGWKKAPPIFFIILLSVMHEYTAVHRQNAVSAYLTSQQILPFAFAEQHNRFT